MWSHKLESGSSWWDTTFFPEAARKADEKPSPEDVDQIVNGKYLRPEHDMPSFCDTVPDFIVANIHKMKEVDNTQLRKVSLPIEFPIKNDDLHKIGQTKWKFENDDNSPFSLSAPQIGFPVRVMCYHRPPKLKIIKKKDKYPIITLINPTYEPWGKAMSANYEKCSSVKEVVGLVNRYDRIFYSAYTVMGDLVQGILVGEAARWLQHEVDHMDGILFTDMAYNIMTIKNHRRLCKLGQLEFDLDIPVSDIPMKDDD